MKRYHTKQNNLRLSPLEVAVFHLLSTLRGCVHNLVKHISLSFSYPPHPQLLRELQSTFERCQERLFSCGPENEFQNIYF